jgi:hypothetical protein
VTTCSHVQYVVMFWIVTTCSHVQFVVMFWIVTPYSHVQFVVMFWIVTPYIHVQFVVMFWIVTPYSHVQFVVTNVSNENVASTLRLEPERNFQVISEKSSFSINLNYTVSEHEDSFIIYFVYLFILVSL